MVEQKGGDNRVSAITTADSRRTGNSIMKSKKLSVIVLVVVIAVGLLALFVQRLPGQEPVLEKPLQLSEMDRLKLAITAGDITVCNSFDLVKRDICQKSILGVIGGDDPPVSAENSIIQDAIAQNDASICENIENSVDRETCLIGTGAIEP